MIISEQKPLEEILESLKTGKKIFVVGCGRCATSCATGGEKEVKKIATELEKKGKIITGWVVVEAPCDERLLVRDLNSHSKKLKDSDAVLVMACGAGVQTLSDFIEKPTYPGLNSLFLGKTKRLGKFSELCVMCGDCVLEYTAGICPISRCSKGLLNGPCGGSHNGKCEVDPSYDCAWQLIYERLKKLGQLEKFKKIRARKDYSKVIRPRKVEQ